MQPDAHLLTAPEAQAAFKLSEYDRLTKEEAAAQKQAKKLTADQQCNVERHRNSAIKTFEAPLLSYKRTDDLKDIAAAFNLNDTGTIPDLVAQIQEDMDRHPNLAEDPHFTALY